ncbi:MAG: AgmX/PglI C-terminal domain-containing protein [Deltaproteobacteria bacterium]|nr:AgmX/PglI C-terminal domain-containing protein [Deltaproteobacteria bacterium]
MRVLLPVLFAAACRHPGSPEVPAAQVLGGAGALESSLPRIRACYDEALARRPEIYGEVVLRIAVQPDGSVQDAVSVLDTVSDPQLVRCVERAAHAARLPAPGPEGLLLRFPYLFTSTRTPPEIVRALQRQHGLLPREEPPAADAPPLLPAPGTVETW